MDNRTTDHLLDHALTRLAALFLVIGPDRRVNFIRPANAPCHGRMTDDFLGADLCDLFPGALDTPTDHGLRQLLASRTDGAVEVFEPSHGRWYEIHLYHHADMLTCLALDITARQQAEATLRRTNAALFNAQRAQEDAIIRLRLAITAGSIGTWELDRTSRRITWDDGMYALFGLEAPADPDAPIPFAWHAYIHPDDHALVRHTVNAWLAGRNPGALAHRIVQPGGAVHWLKSSARLIHDPDGQVARVIGLCVDITEERAELERWRPHPTH